MLRHEVGPISQRPSSLRWKLWVELAGGKVRGSRKPSRAAASAAAISKDSLELAQGVDTRLLPNVLTPDTSILDVMATSKQAKSIPLVELASQQPLSPMAAGRRSSVGGPVHAGGIDSEILDSIWPLHLVDAKDKEQELVLFALLGRLPQVIFWYLDQHVFPLTMRFQPSKLSASGQELGGDLLFRCRIGFSGTPSNLLPVEFGACQFEEQDDGRILNTITCPHVVSVDVLQTGWSVMEVLRRVATGGYHALIDTGALITGMDNYTVARTLLELGLANMEACVFLDAADRKMLLLRNGWTTVRLDQSGVGLDRTFTFYDHCHTTGMDIKQHYTARAALTLGKGMTLRDMAQGAYRMRGIGMGQTITVLLIPEIATQIKDCLGAAGCDRHMMQSGNSAQHLEEMASWLIVNGLKAEQAQADMLLLQKLDNIPRKFAYRQMLDLALADRLGARDGPRRGLLKGWAVEVDLVIENQVPERLTLMEIANLRIADAETGGLLHEEDCMLAHQIFAKQFGGVELTEADQAANEAPMQVVVSLGVVGGVA